MAGGRAGEQANPKRYQNSGVACCFAGALTVPDWGGGRCFHHFALRFEERHAATRLTVLASRPPVAGRLVNVKGFCVRVSE